MSTAAHVLADLAGAVLAVTALPAMVEDPPRTEPLFTFQSSAIDESSGLLDEGDTVLTVNDSGAGPEVYAVDAATGRTVGTTDYTTDEVVDVEALAHGPDGSVWVGDIGDNGGVRTSVAVYRLPPVGRGDRTVTAQRFDLRYVGGPRDAETLLVDPRDGRVYVVSKGLFAGQVFAAPRRLRPDHVNVLRPVGRTEGLVTDGAFFPDGRHVLLRTYSVASVHDTGRWRSGPHMTLPHQPQGEGLAMGADGRHVLVSSEGRRTKVFTVPLAPGVLRAVAPSSTPSPPAASAGPASQPAAEPGADGSSPSVDTRRGVLLAALVAVTLATALGVRALFRRRR